MRRHAFAILLAAAPLFAQSKPLVLPTKPPASSQPAKPEYDITRSIKIANEARWEQAAYDENSRFLYLVRNHRVQIIDTVTSKMSAEILERGARAVALVPDLNRGFITNGRENSVTIFDLKSNAVLGKIQIDGDPASCVYDAQSKKVLVCCLEGKCVVPIPADIDPKKSKPDPAIELPGKPTGIVTDDQGAAFVQITDSDEIALISTKTMSLLTRWPAGPTGRPIDLAIDDNRTRLFFGQSVFVPQKGQRLQVMSAIDGHEISGLPIPSPIQSIAFLNGKVFVDTADGKLLIIGQGRDGKYEVQQTLLTAGESGPILVDRKTGTLFIPAIDVDNNRRPVRDSFRILVIEKAGAAPLAPAAEKK